MIHGRRRLTSVCLSQRGAEESSCVTPLWMPERFAFVPCKGVAVKYTPTKFNMEPGNDGFQ